MTDPEPKPGNTPLAELPDGELVLRTQRGDDLAFEELVKRYQGKLYAAVYNMTSNRHDAEDVVQNVFIKAYTALKDFRGGSTFYTWIYRSAINRAINLLRSRGRRQTVSLDDIDAGAERDKTYVELVSKESPVKDADGKEFQIRLNKALMKLSERHRTVVVLHDIQGIEYEELARMLECSPGTIRSRLFYARQKLQKALKEFVS